MITAIVIVLVLLVGIVMLSLSGGDYELRRALRFQKRRLRGREIKSVLPGLLGETKTQKRKGCWATFLTRPSAGDIPEIQH